MIFYCRIGKMNSLQIVFFKVYENHGISPLKIFILTVLPHFIESGYRNDKFSFIGNN